MAASTPQIVPKRSTHSIISGYAENFTGKDLALGVLTGDDAIGLFMNLWVNCYAPLWTNHRDCQIHYPDYEMTIRTPYIHAGGQL